MASVPPKREQIRSDRDILAEPRNFGGYLLPPTPYKSLGTEQGINLKSILDRLTFPVTALTKAVMKRRSNK